MRQCSRAFEQEQATLRRGGEKATTTRFLHEMLVIFQRLETKERQPKTVLSGRFAMATTAIATRLGEDRDDLVREVDRLRSSEVLDFNPDARAEAICVFSRERSFAIGERNYHTAVTDIDNAGG